MLSVKRTKFPACNKTFPAKIRKTKFFSPRVNAAMALRVYKMGEIKSFKQNCEVCKADLDEINDKELLRHTNGDVTSNE